MGADRLETVLAPFAEVLLILLIILAIGLVGGYLITVYIKRNRDRVHRKISQSRRDAQTAHNLFGQKTSSDTTARSGRRSRRGRRNEPNMVVDLFGSPTDRTN